MYEIKNVYKIADKKLGKMCLFGQVVSDERFPEGHHIITSDIVDFDMASNVVITQTGSEYRIQNTFKSREGFLAYLKETYSEEKYNSMLNVIERLENRNKGVL